MAKYLRRPQPVEAVQWNGEPHPLIKTFSIGRKGSDVVEYHTCLDTPLGRQHLDHGDYLVTDANGVTFAVSKAVFEREYDPVAEAGLMSEDA